MRNQKSKTKTNGDNTHSLYCCTAKQNMTIKSYIVWRGMPQLYSC
jgi:hypothetical protein